MCIFEGRFPLITTITQLYIHAPALDKPDMRKDTAPADHPVICNTNIKYLYYYNANNTYY